MAAGWVLQDRTQINRNAALGVAVREFQLPSGPCDYLLFIDGKACGVIEAKPAGTTLSGAAEQSSKYMAQLPPNLASWAPELIFDYESTGDETLFRDMRDPAGVAARSACHRSTNAACATGGLKLSKVVRSMPTMMPTIR